MLTFAQKLRTVKDLGLIDRITRGVFAELVIRQPPLTHAHGGLLAFLL